MTGNSNSMLRYVLSYMSDAMHASNFPELKQKGECKVKMTDGGREGGREGGIIDKLMGKFWQLNTITIVRFYHTLHMKEMGSYLTSLLCYCHRSLNPFRMTFNILFHIQFYGLIPFIFDDGISSRASFECSSLLSH